MVEVAFASTVAPLKVLVLLNVFAVVVENAVVMVFAVLIRGYVKVSADCLLLKVVQSVPERRPFTPAAAMLKSDEVAIAVGAAELPEMLPKMELAAMLERAMVGCAPMTNALPPLVTVMPVPFAIDEVAAVAKLP